MTAIPESGSADDVKLNLGAGGFPIDGFLNLDQSGGWRFEDGLAFPDESVAAITVSHALMYVRERDWQFVFGEFARVLAIGGVVRITEDRTDDPLSDRFGGYPGHRVLTTPALVRRHLQLAGLEAHDVAPDQTLFRDRSLIQRLHGEPPKVFHMEGVKTRPSAGAPSRPSLRSRLLSVVSR